MGFNSGQIYFTTIKVQKSNYNGEHVRHPGRLTEETKSGQAGLWAVLLIIN